MTNLKTKLIFIIIICIVTYLILDKEIIKADSNINTDIQFGIGQNFRIYPSGVHQTEPFIAKDPSNSQIIFVGCNTLNPTTAFRSEGVYTSTNGGTNWFGSDTCKGSPIILHQGDPGVAIDKNGDFILLRLGYHLFIADNI